MILLIGCQQQQEGTAELVDGKEKGVDEGEPLDIENNQEEEVIEVEEVTERFEPLYTINETNWLVKPLDDANEKVVLLTIDDAPEHYSVEMAEILHELNVGAIFFVNGHFLETKEGQEKLRKIYELGFEIGNHTMHHPNLSQLSPQEQRKEITELNDVIEQLIGERPRFFRAPFGVNTDISDKVVKEEGMVAMNWTYGYDWEEEYQDAQSLTEIMTTTPLLIEGANILMHDRKWTKEALADIVTGLQDQGFKIVHPKEIRTN